MEDIVKIEIKEPFWISWGYTFDPPLDPEKIGLDITPGLIFDENLN